MIQDGDVSSGGIRWQYSSEREARSAIGNEGEYNWPLPYTDIGEMVESLVCQDSRKC